MATISSRRTDRGELAAALEPLFGALSARALDDIAERLEWIDLPGGRRLFRQGERGDSLYILVSGRLQAVVEEGDDDERIVGEIAVGESVGEMALLTGEPRSAGIYAVRDSLLARLSSRAFEELSLNHPTLVTNLSRLVIRRLRRTLRGGEPRRRVRNVALVFHGDVEDRVGFVDRLKAALADHGTTMVLNRERIAAELTRQGSADRLTRWIDDQEHRHRFTLWVADRTVTEWTRRCVRQADRVLVVAPSDASCRPEEIERSMLASADRVGRVPYELVLLHPNGDRPPTKTRRWFEGRDIDWHHHVRLDRDDDLQRVARFVAGKAVGMVFAGGGARGFAHIGVLQAIREAAIPIDMAAGTSIGALMGAAVSTDWDHSTLVSRYRKAFTEKNPLNDYNLLPLVSLMRGHRIDRLLQDNFGEIGIEDLWLPFFCISSNLTRAVTAVHRRGLLWKALRASVALPGVVPPVVFGNDLHIDGGTSDNFPVGEMRRLGAGRVIASNLAVLKSYELEYDEVPSTWRLIWDRYITRRRTLKVPGLVNTLVRATVLGSLEKGHDAARQADLYFETPLKVGLMSWGAFDAAKTAGYKHAVSRLEASDLARGGWVELMPRADRVAGWLRASIPGGVRVAPRQPEIVA